MKREDFSYSCNSRGYTIVYKGVNIGGAGILAESRCPTGKAVQKQISDYKNQAEITINNFLSGRGWAFALNTISAIDAGGILT